MHVLELRDRLMLTAGQEAKARELMHAMFAESRPKGARLLEAEARLRRLFGEQAADEAAVRAAVAEVERARSEVRLVTCSRSSRRATFSPRTSAGSTTKRAGGRSLTPDRPKGLQ